jgi:pimeloyl-ACP methyl ester carboxylesterase
MSMMNRRDFAGFALAPDEGHGGGKAKRTFVLIHGAWHGGSAWDGVAERLRQAGHDVAAPTLPGMNPGENRLGIEFGDYVDAVVNAVRQHGKGVTLVGHSSAGMLVQAAVPRVADAVDLMVFSNAFVVANDQSQLENISPDAAATLTALSQTTPDRTVPVEPLDAFIRSALMAGDPVATQDALLQRLQSQPFSLLSGTVDTPALREAGGPHGGVVLRARPFCGLSRHGCAAG